VTSPRPEYDVVVVGAGIVGLAAALELARRQRRTAVLERGVIDGGCAVGSAGHLVPSHVIPLAAPGALIEAVGALLRRDGALSVSWTTAPAFWRWIVGFVRSCDRRSAATAAPALGELARLSTEMWDDWLAGSGAKIADDGLFDVYAGERAFAGARRRAGELRRWGVGVDVVDGAAALALEPALREPVAGAVLLRDDRSVRPASVLAELIRRTAAAGADLVSGADVIGFSTDGGRVTNVETTGGDFATGHVVLATGAWTGALARLLGERVPMLAARGLSMTVARPQLGPRRTLLLGEHHVAVTPIDDELRLSAWFQLNNFDTTPTLERIERLEALARGRVRLDPTLEVRQRWAGLRPVTPDGVPIIGTSTRWRNVTIAAGHGMIGLTLGPGTGRVVAQLACGEPPDIVLDRFSPRRFA
jgi:D-amino-acid dehydrogenase